MGQQNRKSVPRLAALTAHSQNSDGSNNAELAKRGAEKLRATMPWISDARWWIQRGSDAKGA